MRLTIIGAVMMGLIQTLVAQRPSAIDAPIRGEFRIANPGLLTSCDVGIAVEQIARQAKVLVGFENPPDCWVTGRSREAGDDAESLTGLSPREAFNRLVTVAPTFSWREINGVVVVRPTSAWSDPANPLNLHTARFVARNEPLHDVLHSMLDAVTPPLSVRHTDFPTPVRAAIGPVSVVFDGGTMLDALNALVRARQDLYWQLGYVAHGATITVSTLELSERTVMVPLALPGEGRRKR